MRQVNLWSDRAWTQVLVFGVLSALGTGLHFAVLYAAVEWAEMPAVAGSTLGAVCGMLFNYVAHYHFTFGSAAPHRRSLPLFFAGGAISIVLNLVLMMLFLALDLNYLLAQLLSTLLVFVFNFFYAKHVAFPS
ncbi:MAG: GtrA family protein [Pseudomonadota bacterium]|nr:GtrA family protein [Pseudomonadota bacterium]